MRTTVKLVALYLLLVVSMLVGALATMAAALGDSPRPLLFVPLAAVIYACAAVGLAQGAGPGWLPNRVGALLALVAVLCLAAQGAWNDAWRVPIVGGFFGFLIWVTTALPDQPLKTSVALVVAGIVSLCLLPPTVFRLWTTIVFSRPYAWPWAYAAGALSIVPWVVSASSALVLRRHHPLATTVTLTTAILAMTATIMLGIAIILPYPDPDGNQGLQRPPAHGEVARPQV